VEVARPPAIGDQAVVKRLRSVLFSEPILAAARTRPRGLLKGMGLQLVLGAVGQALAAHVTDPLPSSYIYVALTPVDVRLFSKPIGSEPLEIGRWPKHTYRASVTDSLFTLRLDLELERLGHVRLFAPKNARPVVDLVAQSASGPAMPAYPGSGR
jgi:hypothetical protein